MALFNAVNSVLRVKSASCYSLQWNTMWCIVSICVIIVCGFHVCLSGRVWVSVYILYVCMHVCINVLYTVLYFTGVFRSLQLAYSISSQDVLTAMDYCEESLQEIDITSFLQILCGHVRTFREQHEPHRAERTGKTLRSGATFTIGKDEDERTGGAMLVSSSR